MKLVSTEPFASSRATATRRVWLTVVKMPPRLTVPFGCGRMAYTAPSAPVPTSKLVSTAPVELDQPASEAETRTEPPWITLVWNDPVNLMSYVTYVFQEYFGYDKAKAEKLMLDVHEKGKAVVSNGSREEMERDTEAMHGYGLWATFQKDS